jgi:transcriptional regulator with XRE-family HTH domain
MATELDITQATYSRIESEDSKLSIGRLQEIAKILGIDIADLFDSFKITTQNQANNDGVYSNDYVENLHIENKETVKKLIQILENENQHLKKEIEFLRSILLPDV